ncbi:MAG: hypothetical protein H7319_00990 [Spirosoma sp.]|nr:hypothetical protein [Spirosoma sp.]
MKTLLLTALLAGSITFAFGQDKAVENQKFALLNNGATVGMIIKSVIKFDQKRLSLTDVQLPRARQIITTATVAFNDGVKALKKSGMNQKKLRTLAVTVEDDKVRQYKTILTPAQYQILAVSHKKTYPESRI